ncbi:MAG: hypothetical protein ACLPND_05255 [Candidatus Korobacteraceae bacterium]
MSMHRLLLLAIAAAFSAVAAAQAELCPDALPSRPAACSYLILQGTFIPGPYTVQVAGDRVLVNGRDLQAEVSGASVVATDQAAPAPVYIQLVDTDDGSLPSEEEVRAENLQRLARLIEDSLARGELVIVQDEGHWFTSLPTEGTALLQKITEIVNDVSDEASRYELLRHIVPDEMMARAIASRMQ